MSAENDNSHMHYTSAEFAFDDASRGVLPPELRDLRPEQERVLQQFIEDMLTIVGSRADRESALADASDKNKQLKDQLTEKIQELRDHKTDHIDNLRTIARVLGVEIEDAKSESIIIARLQAEIIRLNEVMGALRTIGAYVLKKEA